MLPVLADTSETLLLDVLAAVADPVRLDILRALARESLCVCHLQTDLGLKQTLVSHHLAAVRRAGLVDVVRAGRFTYYRLRPGALDPLHATIGELAGAALGGAPRRPC